MKPTRQRNKHQELTELATKLRVDGLEIEARCWRIPPAGRYEIELCAGDRRAVVDLPASVRSQLPVRIRQAIDAFRASLQISGTAGR